MDRDLATLVDIGLEDILLCGFVVSIQQLGQGVFLEVPDEILKARLENIGQGRCMSIHVEQRV